MRFIDVMSARGVCVCLPPRGKQGLPRTLTRGSIWHISETSVRLIYGSFPLSLALQETAKSEPADPCMYTYQYLTSLASSGAHKVARAW